MLLNLLVLYTFIITLFKEIDNTKPNTTISNENLTNLSSIPTMIELTTLPITNLSSTISPTINGTDIAMNSTTSYQNLINSVLLTTAMATGMSSDMSFSTDFSSSPSTFVDLYENTTIDFNATESTWNSTFNSTIDDYYTDYDNATQSTNLFDTFTTTMQTTTNDLYNGTANEYEYYRYDDQRFRRAIYEDENDESDDNYRDEYENNDSSTITAAPEYFRSTIVNDSIDNENETFYSSSMNSTTEFTTDGPTQSTDYSSVSDFTISTDFTTDSMSSTYPTTEFELSDFESSTMNELMMPTVSSSMSTLPEQNFDQNGNPVNFVTGEQQQNPPEQIHKNCWETRFGQELVKLTVLDLVITMFLFQLEKKKKNPRIVRFIEH